MKRCHCCVFYGKNIEHTFKNPLSHFHTIHVGKTKTIVEHDKYCIKSLPKSPTVRRQGTSAIAPSLRSSDVSKYVELQRAVFKYLDEEQQILGTDNLASKSTM